MGKSMPWTQMKETNRHTPGEALCSNIRISVQYVCSHNKYWKWQAFVLLMGSAIEQSSMTFQKDYLKVRDDEKDIVSVSSFPNANS